VFFDNNAFRIATIGNASKVYIRRVIGESHVRAELLKTSLTLLAVTVGVNQAAHCGKVPCLEFGDCCADFGHTADDLMSGNTGIDGGHRAPLVTDLVEVGVADTAKKDFDLNIVFTWITPRDCSRGKR
jgi:hypothetical protein